MAKRPSTTDLHRARLKALRAAMDAEGVDHLLVTNLPDITYLTGFNGSSAHVLVGPSGKPTLITDGRYAEASAALRPVAKVVIRTGPILHKVAELVADAQETTGVAAVGIQSEFTTLTQDKALRAAFKKHKVSPRLIVGTTGLVTTLRRTKDASEIALMRKAVRIQEDAFEAILKQVGPGWSELEACALLEYEMKARGSTNAAFDTIVAAQANGSLPHYRPGTKKLAQNKPLLVDWGATHAGYRSDMTRVVSFGRWPAKIREIYAIVLEAHEAAADALKPGRTCREMDFIAREVIRKAGYAKKYNHSLGHSIGLETHEAPGLAALAPDEELEPGMVFTIEPGIYLPGIGGVRIEDIYVVTQRGSRNLCSLPKDIDWATR